LHSADKTHRAFVLLDSLVVDSIGAEEGKSVTDFGTTQTMVDMPLEFIMNSQAITIVEGDLLDQDVDVNVNTWNRNLIPW
jgi:hypothetical protein